MGSLLGSEPDSERRSLPVLSPPLSRLTASCSSAIVLRACAQEKYSPVHYTTVIHEIHVK